MHACACQCAHESTSAVKGQVGGGAGRRCTCSRRLCRTCSATMSSCAAWPERCSDWQPARPPCPPRCPPPRSPQPPRPTLCPALPQTAPRPPARPPSRPPTFAAVVCVAGRSFAPPILSLAQFPPHLTRITALRQLLSWASCCAQRQLREVPKLSPDQSMPTSHGSTAAEHSMPRHLASHDPKALTDASPRAAAHFDASANDAVQEAAAVPSAFSAL